MPYFEPDHYYRTDDPELSVIATPNTMRQWRHKGKGPPYIKPEGRVFYEGRALNEWLNAHEVLPTNS